MPGGSIGGGFLGTSIGSSFSHPYMPITTPNIPNLGTNLITGASVRSSNSNGVTGSGLNPS